MKLSVKNIQGGNAGELEVKFEVIENGRGSQAVHDAVVATLAGRRAGTHSTKTMGEVAGSGKKPWRQKGTGRARAGSFASPLWRGGGITHGPKPRDYSKKVNLKVKKLALRKALSERIKSGDVLVVDDLQLSSPKTKEFIKVMDKLGLDGTTLFVVGEGNENAEKASRNISYVGMISAREVGTYEVLKFDKVVFTKAGFEAVEARIA